MKKLSLSILWFVFTSLLNNVEGDGAENCVVETLARSLVGVSKEEWMELLNLCREEAYESFVVIEDEHILFAVEPVTPSPVCPLIYFEQTFCGRDKELQIFTHSLSNTRIHERFASGAYSLGQRRLEDISDAVASAQTTFDLWNTVTIMGMGHHLYDIIDNNCATLPLIIMDWLTFTVDHIFVDFVANHLRSPELAGRVRMNSNFWKLGEVCDHTTVNTLSDDEVIFRLVVHYIQKHTDSTDYEHFNLCGHPQENTNSFYIVNRGTGYYLDAINGCNYDGGLVAVDPDKAHLSGPRYSMQFHFGIGGKIISDYCGEAIEVEYNSWEQCLNGNRVHLEEPFPHAGERNQDFEWVPDGRIVNIHYCTQNKVMLLDQHVEASLASNRVQLWEDGDGINQRWNRVPVMG